MASSEGHFFSDGKAKQKKIKRRHRTRQVVFLSIALYEKTKNTQIAADVK